MIKKAHFAKIELTCAMKTQYLSGRTRLEATWAAVYATIYLIATTKNHHGTVQLILNTRTLR